MSLDDNDWCIKAAATLATSEKLDLDILPLGLLAEPAPSNLSSTELRCFFTQLPMLPSSLWTIPSAKSLKASTLGIALLVASSNNDSVFLMGCAINLTMASTLSPSIDLIFNKEPLPQSISFSAPSTRPPSA